MKKTILILICISILILFAVPISAEGTTFSETGIPEAVIEPENSGIGGTDSETGPLSETSAEVSKTLEEYIQDLAPEQAKRLAELLQAGIENLDIKDGVWDKVFTFISDHIFSVSFLLVSIFFIIDLLHRRKSNKTVKEVISTATNNAVEITEKAEELISGIESRYQENNQIVKEYKDAIEKSNDQVSHLMQSLQEKEKELETINSERLIEYEKNQRVLSELSSIVNDLIQLSYIPQQKKDEIAKRHYDALSIISEKVNTDEDAQ